MVVNFKKLKTQIKPFKPEEGFNGRKGYMFIATKERKNRGVCSVKRPGSKRGLIAALVEFIQYDADFKREFTL